jgi:hypothetical protein
MVVEMVEVAQHEEGSKTRREMRRDGRDRRVEHVRLPFPRSSTIHD